MAEWTPFKTHCFSENVALRIEPGTSLSVANNSEHQTTERRSWFSLPYRLVLFLLKSRTAKEGVEGKCAASWGGGDVKRGKEVGL
jgi:hypothetical protein